MKLGILGPGEKVIGYTTKRLLEEGRKVFKQVDLLPVIDIKLRIDDKPDAILGKKSLKYYDYILPRIDSKRAVIGYPIMRFLDSLGVRKPYSAETVLIAHNKFLTLQKLVERDIKVPKTYLTGSKKSAIEIVNKEKMPIILKLLSGFGGQGVIFMESKDAALSAIETLRTLKQEVCLEEYIQNPGEDYRGIVAGDEIIASYKRKASEGEKRANLYSGGKAEAFKLGSDMEEIVLKSTEAIGSKLCAVDMLKGKETYVIEVNINPGIRGIEKATNINVAHRMIDFVQRELKK